MEQSHVKSWLPGFIALGIIRGSSFLFIKWGAVVCGMLALGAIGTGVAYILNFQTIRAAGGTVASTVTFITPVVATGLGIWLLNEKFSYSQIVGGLLVVLSAALVQERIKLIKVKVKGD